MGLEKLHDTYSQFKCMCYIVLIGIPVKYLWFFFIFHFKKIIYKNQKEWINKIINFDFIWLEALFSGKSCKIKLIIKIIRIILFLTKKEQNIRKICLLQQLKK